MFDSLNSDIFLNFLPFDFFFFTCMSDALVGPKTSKTLTLATPTEKKNEKKETQLHELMLLNSKLALPANGL